MPTDEAIDLIDTLPQGSMYAAATNPLRAWSDERHLTADVRDEILMIAWAIGAFDREAHPEPPRVTRPRDILERARVKSRNRHARQVLETDGWEEI